MSRLKFVAFSKKIFLCVECRIQTVVYEPMNFSRLGIISEK